jgi:hypothetical protein
MWKHFTTKLLTPEQLQQVMSRNINMILFATQTLTISTSSFDQDATNSQTPSCLLLLITTPFTSEQYLPPLQAGRFQGNLLWSSLVSIPVFSLAPICHACYYRARHPMPCASVLSKMNEKKCSNYPKVLLSLLGGE